MATHSSILFFFFFNLFVFLAVLGLCCCTGFSLAVESWGCHPGVAHEFLIAVASFSHGLRACAQQLRPRGSRAQAQQLWCPGSVAWGIFPDQGTNQSPTSAGGFFTTEPPGKPHSTVLAWRIPWSEQLGRLQSVEPQKAGYE